jgi:molecular chaperone DnaK
METTIGIDLGTTFSAVAHVDASGRAVILKNAQGEPLTPSVIWFGDDAEPLVGAEAKRMQEMGDDDVASFFKRDMGDPNFFLDFKGKKYTASDLSAIVLRRLKADAEATLGKPVRKAVVTVPAYFNNQQREATIEAGRAAGLEILRIINEPTAAAIAFGLNQTQRNGQKILVYDLGGGTFDVTVIRQDADGIEVIGTDGDHNLGGKNWDDRLIAHIARQFEDEFSVNPLADTVSFNDLLVRAENAKKQLSARDSTTVTIAHAGNKGRYEITAATFEDITRDLMQRTQMLTEHLLSDIRLNWRDLDGVLLVGGSTRMPMVSRWIAQMSGKAPLRGVNVDEAVALGAAIQANLDANGNSPAATQFFLGGAAPKIRDVMAHSLGMVAENADRSRYINSILIPKNKPVPSEQTKPYVLRTRPGDRNSMEVYMLQGESERPLDCNVIGKYIFSGIEHQPGGQDVVDVTYAYDANGVISVHAQQRSNGKALPLHIEPVPDDLSWLDLPPKTEELVPAHLSVVLAVDLSGSMAGEPLEKAQQAAKGFVHKLDLSSTSIGLLVFAESARVTQDLSQNAKQLEKGIGSWDTGIVGYGTSAQPFTEAFRLLADRDDPRFIVVLTDGMWSGQDHAIREAERCKEAGIEIIAIGFGTADRHFLQQIATSDENALLTDLGNLTASFSKIAQVLTESGGLALGGSGKKGGGLGVFSSLLGK